jgi:hypothetical protein
MSKCNRVCWVTQQKVQVDKDHDLKPPGSLKSRTAAILIESRRFSHMQGVWRLIQAMND